MKQNDDTIQDIGDGECDSESEHTGESTLSSDIEEQDLDHQLEVLHLGEARREKSL